MISPLQASLGSQHFNYNKEQLPTAVAQQIFFFPLEKSQGCSLVCRVGDVGDVGDGGVRGAVALRSSLENYSCLAVPGQKGVLGTADCPHSACLWG